VIAIAARSVELMRALNDIKKLIQSKRQVFETGSNGLQSKRACATQIYLQMVVVNKRKGVVSELAAESGLCAGISHPNVWQIPGFPDLLALLL
jgi:hypothetical protein